LVFFFFFGAVYHMQPRTEPTRKKIIDTTGKKCYHSFLP
jgi:hypothetical protein